MDELTDGTGNSGSTHDERVAALRARQHGGHRRPRAWRARRATGALSLAACASLAGAMAIFDSPASTQVASKSIAAAGRSSDDGEGDDDSATVASSAANSSTASTATAHTTTRGS